MLFDSIHLLTKRVPYARRIGLKIGHAHVDVAARCVGFSRVCSRANSRSTRGMTRRGRRTIGCGASAWCWVALGIIGPLAWPSISLASHAADHRFTVEGFVCGSDGKGRAGVDVLVKDTRITYGQTVQTDGDGYYKVTLHLHNDNVGDPLLVEVGGEQQNHKIQFDPNDLETERKLWVSFGSGCESDLGPPKWFLIGLGVSAVAILGWIGLKISRKRAREEQRQRKGQGKRHK